MFEKLNTMERPIVSLRLCDGFTVKEIIPLTLDSIDFKQSMLFDSSRPLSEKTNAYLLAWVKEKNIKGRNILFTNVNAAAISMISKKAVGSINKTWDFDKLKFEYDLLQNNITTTKP
jgi:hypothetical protein